MKGLVATMFIPGKDAVALDKTANGWWGVTIGVWFGSLLSETGSVRYIIVAALIISIGLSIAATIAYRRAEKDKKVKHVTA